MSLSLSHISCGVRELHDLSGFRSVQEIIALIRYAHPVKERAGGYSEEYSNTNGLGNENIRPAFFIFSNVSNSRRTATLCKYIADNNLGTVLSTESALNPNSGNHIKVHIWKVNWKEMDKMKGERVLVLPGSIYGYEYRYENVAKEEEGERDAA